MDWGKWGKKLTGLFGGSAVAPVKIAQNLPPPPPEVLQTMAQIQQGTHRQYSPQELDSLSGFIRTLKDVTQTNMLAMGSLLQAKPKTGFEEAALPLVEELKALGGKPYEQTQDMLGNYVLWATQVEATRSKAAAYYNPNIKNDHLPVTDVERLLVAGVTQAAMGVYKQMTALVKQIKVVEDYLDVPQIERIKAEYEAQDESMKALIVPLCAMATQSVGKAPAAAVSSQPVTMRF